MFPENPDQAPDPGLPKRVCAAVSSFVPVLVWCCGVLGAAVPFWMIAAYSVTIMALAMLSRPDVLERVLAMSLVIASASLALAAGDVGLRVVGREAVYYRAHEELLRSDPRHPRLSRYVPMASSRREIFGDLAAMSGDGSARQIRKELFVTDELGFRNEPASAGERNDLLVIGDSFGMGLGSSQEASWTSVLSRRTGRKIYSLSMPATCPAHGYANLLVEGPSIRLAEDAVVALLVYSGNDLNECTTGVNDLLEPGDSGRAAFDGFRSRSPLRQLGIRFVYDTFFADPVVTSRELGDGRKMLFYKPHGAMAALSRDGVEALSGYANIRAGIEGIARFASGKGLRLHVISVPSKEMIYGWILNGRPAWGERRRSGLDEAVESLCRDSNLPYFDLSAPLSVAARSAFESGETIWWLDDSHWNERGHGVVADEIQRVIWPS